MGFLHTVCPLFIPHIGTISLVYALVGGLVPSVLSGPSVISRAQPDQKRLAIAWVLVRTLFVMYVAERLVYFFLPEIIAPYSGASNLMVFIWVIAAISAALDGSVLGEKKMSSTSRVSLLAWGGVAFLLLFSTIILTSQWDLWGPVAKTSSSLIGDIGIRERGVDENGFPADRKVSSTEIDQGHRLLVSPEHAQFIAFTSYAKLPNASRLAISQKPSLTNYHYYFPLYPQGIFAQGYLQREGVPYIAASSLTPNTDGEIVKAAISYGDRWLLDRNTRRIAWQHDARSRIISHRFFVDPVKPDRPEEWYLRGKPLTGWKNVIITHATVVDATTGAVRTVQRSDFPESFRQVLPTNLAIARFDGWGIFRFGYGYQWFTGPRVNLYHHTADDEVVQVWGTNGDLYFQIPVQYRNTTSGSTVGYALVNERTEQATFYIEPSAGVDKLDGMILSDIARSNIDYQIGPTSRVDLFEGLVHGYLTVIEIPDIHGARYKEVAVCEPSARKCAVAEKPEAAIAKLRGLLVQDAEGWQTFFATRGNEILTLGKSLILPKGWLAQIDEHPARYLHAEVDLVPNAILFADPGTKVLVQYLDSGANLEVESIALAS